MHGEVGAAFGQRDFQFLEEHALAADRRQRTIQHLVATRHKWQQFDRQTHVGVAQAPRDVFGLPQGERAFSGGDAKRRVGHGVRTFQQPQSIASRGSRCFATQAVVHRFEFWIPVRAEPFDKLRTGCADHRPRSRSACTAVHPSTPTLRVYAQDERNLDDGLRRSRTQIRKRCPNAGTRHARYAITSAFNTAVSRTSCGIVSPARSSPIPNSAAATRNTAFQMLLPAITRDNSSGALRLCTNANSGTMKRPVETPINARSSANQPCPGACRNASQFVPRVDASACCATNSSTPNTVMPAAPSGTSPTSTACRDSFSHSSEPMPTPTENRVSTRISTLASPPRYSRV